MLLDELCDRFVSIYMDEEHLAIDEYKIVVAEFSKAVDQDRDYSWIVKALSEPIKRVLIRSAFEDQKLIPSLLTPYINAMAHVNDSCGVRYYVKPCVRSFGYRNVIQAMIDKYNVSDDWEKRGVLDAFYWVKYVPITEVDEQYRSECSIKDLKDELYPYIIKDFSVTDLIQLKRSIISLLNSEDFGSLEKDSDIERLFIAAQNDEDYYIRQRTAVMLSHSHRNTSLQYA